MQTACRAATSCACSSSDHRPCILRATAAGAAPAAATAGPPLLQGSWGCSSKAAARHVTTGCQGGACSICQAVQRRIWPAACCPTHIHCRPTSAIRCKPTAAWCVPQRCAALLGQQSWTKSQCRARRFDCTTSSGHSSGVELALGPSGLHAACEAVAACQPIWATGPVIEVQPPHICRDPALFLTVARQQ